MKKALLLFALIVILSSQGFTDQYVTNCLDDTNPGSLRYALTNAGVNESIIFDITLAAAGYSSGESYPGLVTTEAGSNTWFRIMINTDLPLISNNGVQVRGSTQTREATNAIGPKVEVRAGVTPGYCFEIRSSNVTLEGLAVNRRWGGVSGTGIYLYGGSGGADNNHIYGCYVGVSATGESYPDPGLSNQLNYGIHLASGASNNRIGDHDPTRKNIFSGNRYYGIFLTGSGTDSNIIINSYIGTDRTGSVDMGNIEDGVYISNGAQYNQIGDGTSNGRNIISGNDDDGVRMIDSTTRYNSVLGNYIGTTVSGEADLGNGERGVYIGINASLNYIGGDVSGEGNVISGNGQSTAAYNVQIAGGTSNEVLGNIIGLDKDGTDIIQIETDSGIGIDGGSYHVVGNGTAGGRNIISGNYNGIYLFATTNNRILGNFIGTDINGTADKGNTLHGIYLLSSANYNTIGDGTTGGRNIISGNNNNGILIHDGADNNEIYGNFIGMDVNGTTALANSQNGISLTSGSHDNKIGGSGSGQGNVISANTYDGIVFSGANTNSNEVYANLIGLTATGLTTEANGSGGVYINGGEYNYIGSTEAAKRNYIGGHNGSGDYGVRLSSLANPSRYNYISGNFIGLGTDESVCANDYGVEIYGGATYNYVLGNVISGNSTVGVRFNATGTNSNEVLGNFIGTDSTGMLDKGNGYGIYMMTSCNYNRIGDGTVAGRNFISGNDQDGIYISTCESNSILGNYIGIKANGTESLPNTLDGIYILYGSKYIQIGNATTTGRNIISGNGSDGIELEGTGTNSHEVYGNYIGTDANGSANLGNSANGINFDEGPDHCKIGDGTTAGLNLISGNGNDGINLDDADQNEVKGNIIGTNVSGTSPLGNTMHGIHIASQAKYNIIGGLGALEGNLISSNGQHGIFISSAGTNSNEVTGNLIGTAADGSSDLGNTQYGILIDGTASNNQIGRSNTIAYNGNASYPAGIKVDGSGTDHNYITYNSIFSNYGIGILLSSGANEGIATPEVITADLNEFTSLTQVTGEGAPALGTVEAYKAENGQGRTYLTTAIADALGQFSFTATGLSSGDSVVVTASTTNPSTSQFSLPGVVIASVAKQYQPDNMIGTLESGSDYVGEGIFNTDGTNQTKSQSIYTGSSATYYIKIMNSGNTSDEVTVTGTASSGAWNVTYYDAKTGGNDITSQVIGSGWSTGSILSTESQEIRVVVANSGSAASSFDVLITSTSSNNTSAQDAVKGSTAASVAPSGIDHFNTTGPDTAIAGVAFSSTITAKDSADNTVDVTGTTLLTVDDGTVSPTSIESSSFTSGVFTGDLTLSKPGSRTITVTNGSATGTLSVLVTNATREYTSTELGVPGMTITIPAGAATAEVTITASITTSPGDPPPGYGLGGDVFNITSSPITNFLKPVTVTIPISGPLTAPKVYYWDGTSWSSDGITIISHDTTSLTFTTTHFTVFAPMAALPSNLVRFGPNPYNPNNGSGRFWYWLNADSGTTIYLIDLAGSVVWKQSYSAGANGGKAGENNIEFDGRTAWGDQLGQGVYVYKIVQGGRAIGGGKIAVIK